MTRFHIVVMGVSGCGKSSAGRAIAERLGISFVEGDDLHPPENLERMSRGLPLDDEMRWPWLERIAASLLEHPEGAVASCSALKQSYRERLSKDCPIFFIHLDVEREILVKRMTAREHFMPVSLLESQLQTLEPLASEEPGITISGSIPLDQLVCRSLSAIERLTDRAKISAGQDALTFQ